MQLAGCLWGVCVQGRVGSDHPNWHIIVIPRTPSMAESEGSMLEWVLSGLKAQCLRRQEQWKRGGNKHRGLVLLQNKQPGNRCWADQTQGFLDVGSKKQAWCCDVFFFVLQTCSLHTKKRFHCFSSAGSGCSSRGSVAHAQAWGLKAKKQKSI